MSGFRIRGFGLLLLLLKLLIALLLLLLRALRLLGLLLLVLLLRLGLLLLVTHLFGCHANLMRLFHYFLKSCRIPISRCLVHVFGGVDFGNSDLA